MWFYDAVYNTWNESSASPIDSTTAHGAGAVDPNQGVGYYYGGWKTVRTTYNAGGDTIISDLVSYGFDNQVFKRMSFGDSTPRAEGTLYYLPVSDAGMLIYFGGIQQTSNGTAAVSSNCLLA